ncbi:DNA-binding NarL/FixJ family response regulator [Allocatelliglobosispora scoriae]|uniref:DNA-binding NarL/FixJ family response regulator n=1 Tax=Allocatelliglobosispora scoriae TaxID=643052 RepID=A0A841BXQ2_9ACTN|nr:response regulator transcription factor [Allocatelliglobosispora scoriae]MBB5871552.1 DNA-binding NarL/FixJ family response regulator [Allocatelliglobosispora scoriae]
MQTVLVCVRSVPAAQSVAACAHRLGIGSAVRTAVTTTDAIAQLVSHPADIILVDTGLSRPDTVGFTRRVLAVAPAATMVLFGSEDPQTARAAIDAGARGLIGGGDHEVVAAAAKALLLVMERIPAGTPAGRHVGQAMSTQSLTRPTGQTSSGAWTSAPVGRSAPGVNGPVRAGWPTRPPLPGQTGTSTMVPAQRADATLDGDQISLETRQLPVGRPVRSVTLTERELQVLRGMADGRSNAEIGRELFVSEDTVKTHARRLFRKLGARDRAHAVAAGFRQGLVV